MGGGLGGGMGGGGMGGGMGGGGQAWRKVTKMKVAIRRACAGRNRCVRLVAAPPVSFR